MAAAKKMAAAKSSSNGNTNWTYRQAAMIAVAGFLLATTQSSCGFFPESSFTLSPDSRLPRGITLPSGLIRSDIVIRLDYYIDPSGRRYVVTLQDKEGKKLDEVSGYLGKLVGSTAAYPACEWIDLWGYKETVVHLRMEPLFYLMDECPVKALNRTHSE